MRTKSLQCVGALAAIVMAAGLGACGIGAEETAIPASVSSPAATSQPTNAAPSETPANNEFDAEGTAISRSDVSSIPDSPLTGGEVLFIPEVHAKDLGEFAGFDPSDAGNSHHVSFQLDESRLVELEGTVADIDEDGWFPFELPTGQYIVCLANIFPGHTAGPPYAVIGCDLADISDDNSLTVSHGEGGVEVGSD